MLFQIIKTLLLNQLFLIIEFICCKIIPSENKNSSFIADFGLSKDTSHPYQIIEIA